MAIKPEIYHKLKVDFPQEAYSKDSSRGFNLTSLKAQYIVERLNDVLGIDGWRLTNSKFEADEDGVLYIGTFVIISDGTILHEIDAIGYSSDKKNKGDAYKGARTDALSKAASYIGVGNDMFKGLISPETGKKQATSVKLEKSTYTTNLKSLEAHVKMNTAPVNEQVVPDSGAFKRPLGTKSNGSAGPVTQAPVKKSPVWDSGDI